MHCAATPAWNLRAASLNGRARLRHALAAAAVLAMLVGCAAPPVAPAPEGAGDQPATSAGTASRQGPAPALRPSRRLAGPVPSGQAAPAPAEPPAPASPAEEASESPATEGVLLGRGVASWYGPQFHGRRTASGERFDRNEYTAAHRTLPFGSRVCVRSAITGKAVVVRINDRGPFSPGRVIDLSQAAAEELGMLGLGLKPVELWQLGDDEESCPEGLDDAPDEALDAEAQPARRAAPVAAKPKARSKAKQPARKRRR
jgi:rare lipoprotein A